MIIKIYKITNPIGKVYIGQTKDVYKRKYAYSFMRCKSQVKLYNSIVKYGWSNHTFEILERTKLADADKREIHYIQLYKSFQRQYGLNLTIGGLRPKHTDETKKKLSQMFMGGKHGKARKLYQYTEDGQFVKEWECMKCIQRELGYVTTWLSKATKNNKIAYGYKWSYVPLH